MKIFVVNCGSSSMKYQLVDIETEKVLAKGHADRIGMEGSLLKYIPGEQEAIVKTVEIKDHMQAVKMALDDLLDPDTGVIKELSDIDAIGHRVVHGGEKFVDSVLITDYVFQGIVACSELAPLHNPPNIIGIEACMKIMPNAPQVAVFDTAFHQTLPKVAYIYGLPYELYLKYGIRRYGFHGTSHKYVAQVAASMMGEHMTDLRIITCHLGNGASLTAIKYGKSIDTTMGFTPLEGLVMGTRSGELDPAILPFIMEKEHMSGSELDEYLNRKSGLLGISGMSSDFRDLAAAAKDGDERSQLAIDIFAYKVKKYIGSYVAAMGGVDAIVFTAGLGENSPDMRDKICNGLEYLGTRIDHERNQVPNGQAQEISARRSQVRIFVIPTNEELVIARDTASICRPIIRHN